MSNFLIRKLDVSEAYLLKEFTYLAIYVPQGAKTPPKSIVELPELKIYYQDFGSKKGGICLVTETDNKIVGAVWTRIVNDFAHIDDNTPSLAIAVLKASRSKGIGNRLLAEMLKELKDEVAPAKKTLQYIKRTPNAVVKVYDCGHFDIYFGKYYDEAIADYIAFFKEIDSTICE